MSDDKKKQESAEKTDQAKEKNETEAKVAPPASKEKQDAVQTPTLSWGSFLIANVAFWVFLIALMLIAHFAIKDSTGLSFIVVTLGGTFTLISILDKLTNSSGA